MAFPQRPKNALLASYHKDGRLTEFARRLAGLGWMLWGSAGTVRYLAEQGVSITDVATITGREPILGHRVVTLDQRIHAGILYRDQPADLAQIKELGAIPFGLVFVDLYPVQQAIAEGQPLADVVELIDIGGPTLLRAAAKAHTLGCIPVCDLGDYHLVSRLLELDELNDQVASSLAHKVFRVMSAYDGAIAAYLSALGTSRSLYLPMLHAEQALRYGENPHQSAWIYQSPGEDPLAWHRWELLQGKPMSFNNWRDWDAALQALGHLVRLGYEASVVMKHRNPVGCLVAEKGIEAATLLRRAWEGDEQAAFGGVIGLTVPVDLTAAVFLTSRFTEVVMAPSITEEAAEVLAQKNNLRVLVNPALSDCCHHPAPEHEYVQIRGGALRQTANQHHLAAVDLQYVAGPEINEALIPDLLTAWAVCQSAVSNTVCIVWSGRLLGIGAGDPARVQSAETAVAVARRHTDSGMLGSSVAASDSFFPFPDGAEALINAGVKAILHPGGSVNDRATGVLCADRGVSLYYTSADPKSAMIRAFRH